MPRLIFCLPNELLYHVVDLLLSDVRIQRDHNSEPRDDTIHDRRSFWALLRPVVHLASTCRSLHRTILPQIYPVAAKHCPSLLFWACCRGHSQLVEQLLIAGLSPNCALFSGDLHPSLRRADLECASAYPFELLNHGIFDDWEQVHQAPAGTCKGIVLRADDRRHRLMQTLVAYPIHLAARGGHHDAIKVLIRHGASADVSSRGLFARENLLRKQCGRARACLVWTPLHFAIESQCIESIQALLDACVEADFFLRDFVFHTAAVIGNEATLDLLLRNLERYVANDRTSRLDKTFVASPLQFPDTEGLSPIVYAHMYGNYATMEHLVRLGADVDGGTELGNTPLMLACIRKETETVKKLINLGANVNIVWGGSTHLYEQLSDLYSTRPLDICCRTDHEASADLVSLLLAAGADIARPAVWSQAHRLGYSGYPVIAAAATHQPAVLWELLRYGADPNMLVEECAPVHPLLAVLSLCPSTSSLSKMECPKSGNGHPEVLTPYVVDRDRATHPLSQADAKTHTDTQRMLECISLLLEHGAQPDVYDREGKNCFDILYEALGDIGRPALVRGDRLPHTCQRSRMSEEISVDVAKLLLNAGSNGNLRYYQQSDCLSFLACLFLQKSYQFCETLVDHGARLCEEPDELKACFSGLLVEIREHAIQHPCPDMPKDHMAALRVLSAMDPQNRFGRDSYFLARVLRVREAPDFLCSFIFERATPDISTLTRSRYNNETMIFHAMYSNYPARFEMILDIMRDSDPTWISLPSHVQLVAAAVSGLIPILNSLIDRGAPIHPSEARGTENDDGGAVAGSNEAAQEMPLPVVIAIQLNDVNRLGILLTRRPLSDAVPGRYHAAYLREAARWTHLHMLALLLAYGADPAGVDVETGETALVSILRWMDGATEEDVTNAWKFIDTTSSWRPVRFPDTGERSQGRRSWLTRWLIGVTMLFRKNEDMCHMDRSGVTVLDYLLRILEYNGSKFFRICLREDARQRWRIVTGIGEDGRSTSVVEVMDTQARLDRHQLRGLEWPEQAEFDRLMAARQQQD